MRLKQLIQVLHSELSDNQIIEIFGKDDSVITGISDNSQKVKSGVLFIAIKGLVHDGHEYIDEAVRNGAVCIVTRKKCKVPENTTLIIVRDPRKSLSLLAASWYGHPSQKLKVIGVTGTKGKTTVIHLLFHILKKNGYRVGMVSTVKAVIGERTYDTGLHVTNPEPLVIQKYLKDMVDAGLEYALLEVTSHGLDQERVFGINFEISVLTNISREHLDYHKTFENYRLAKLKLFRVSKQSVINRDDPSYSFFIKNKEYIGKINSYSQNKNAGLSGRMTGYYGEFMKYSVNYDHKDYLGKINLSGKYNLYNILASVMTAKLMGIDISGSIESLSDFKPPEGRLEKIKNSKGLDIYIDFAHTPDSLENLLELLKSRKKGRLICVFGCAGERDKKKRYKMGVVSGKLADISVVTAEDPRSENVLDIIGQIRRGLKKAGAMEYFGKEGVINAFPGSDSHKKSNGNLFVNNRYLEIPDRYEAIYYAIKNIARKGDTLVICGKGHEKSMCYGRIEHPWSDHTAISESLSAISGKTAVILGAGKGKRLNSDLPKVIHKLAGKPMILYAINNLRKAGYSEIVVVVGHKANLVIREIGYSVKYAYQKVQLGTGHAAWQGIKCITGNNRPVLIINGDDSAFYKQETLTDIYDRHLKSGSLLTNGSTIFPNPTGFGRLVRGKNGKLLKIVEEKVATESEKKIKEINISLYVFDRDWFIKNIHYVKKGLVGEYYLTDLVEIAINKNVKTSVYTLKNPDEWWGINTIEQLTEGNEKMETKLLRGEE